MLPVLGGSAHPMLTDGKGRTEPPKRFGPGVLGGPAALREELGVLGEQGLELGVRVAIGIAGAANLETKQPADPRLDVERAHRESLSAMVRASRRDANAATEFLRLSVSARRYARPDGRMV